MAKIIKMYSDVENPCYKKILEKQWNIEQLKHLVRKYNIPNKKDLFDKIKQEQ